MSHIISTDIECSKCEPEITVDIQHTRTRDKAKQIIATRAIHFLLYNNTNSKLLQKKNIYTGTCVLNVMHTALPFVYLYLPRVSFPPTNTPPQLLCPSCLKPDILLLLIFNIPVLNTLGKY